MRIKGNLAFDFDGVLHSNPHYATRWSDLDFTALRMAQSRGWAVSIMTCNDVHRIAPLLRDAGFQVYADHTFRYGWWDGGKSGKVVLVTNRKVDAVRYFDDKGREAHYGETNWAEALAEAENWQEVAV